MIAAFVGEPPAGGLVTQKPKRTPMRKFALSIAAAGTLGLAAFAAAPAQAAATHLGITQAVPALETMDSSVIQAQWHRRWESRGRWHRRWRSRRWR
jgi:hypothetical protein